jgi:hypothetical protein
MPDPIPPRPLRGRVETYQAPEGGPGSWGYRIIVDEEAVVDEVFGYDSQAEAQEAGDRMNRGEPLPGDCT